MAINPLETIKRDMLTSKKQTYSLAHVLIQHRDATSGEIVKEEGEGHCTEGKATASQSISSSPDCVGSIIDVSGE
jgi:hypothetical protein